MNLTSAKTKEPQVTDLNAGKKEKPATKDLFTRIEAAKNVNELQACVLELAKLTVGV
jgi:hypothetical protein